MRAEAVCIASGPSLTLEDVELVKAWRMESENRFVMVTNTTFKIAPWADALYAVDKKWWDVYGAEVVSTFNGKRFCSMPHHAKGIAETVQNRKRFMHHGNSGAAALAYCATGDFERIIMLGYDCTFDGAKKHWHGDHPKPLGNCGSLVGWQEKFQNVRKCYKSANIVNASRRTALKMFERISLEDALCAQ